VTWVRDRVYRAIARCHGPHAGYERVTPAAPPR
jgi:hypothetical protein